MTLRNNAPYASIKRALATLSLTAREELKSDNITVSVVYPYITLTNFERNTIRDVPVLESEAGTVQSISTRLSGLRSKEDY